MKKVNFAVKCEEENHLLSVMLGLIDNFPAVITIP